MYVSSFCILMRINVFLFSQHGIRAIKEFENNRVKVSPCGQFRQPIQRSCHNRSYYSLHETSRKPNHRRRTLSPATFTGDVHSGRRAHQQERLPPIYLSVEASPENSITHAHTCPHSLISGPARVRLFLHAPPLAGASVADKPIHPLHALHRRLKSPSFSVFLFGHCDCVFLSPESPLFLCFLELYAIFRTLGVVSVDYY